MNNSVYGKTLQQMRNYLDVRIVTNARTEKRLICRPTFQSFHIINDDVTIIKLTKSNVYLNKPLYAGMCVLEVSKLKMYSFHYEHILPVYGDRVKLLFTDTDSLCYHITREDIYLDMQKQISEYDTSDYPIDHFLYSRDNAKVIWKFKDETNSIPPSWSL